jgi:hypothetical protein
LLQQLFQALLSLPVDYLRKENVHSRENVRKTLTKLHQQQLKTLPLLVTENSTEIRIPGFTLCKELQETILSIQTECTQITAESSALPDDSVHHTSSNDVQIIADPGIPEFPTCVVEEEHHVPPCCGVIYPTDQ